jgi:hypothetical protein
MSKNNDNTNTTSNTQYDKPIVTLDIKKSKNELLKWAVTSDFLDQNPKPDIKTLNELDAITKYEIMKYTHNTEGPAIVNVNTGAESFWLNGIPAKKEEVERLKYNKDFSEHVASIIDEE